MKPKYITSDKILTKLEIDKTLIKDYILKLKAYIFVNELDDLKEGSFLRYISIENDYHLSTPCIFCDVKITADGIQLFCKNFWGKTFFHVNLDKNLVFRKLDKDEQVLMSALKKQKL